jgi:hypothetical protein
MACGILQKVGGPRNCNSTGHNSRLQDRSELVLEHCRRHVPGLLCYKQRLLSITQHPCYHRTNPVISLFITPIPRLFIITSDLPLISVIESAYSRGSRQQICNTLHANPYNPTSQCQWFALCGCHTIWDLPPGRREWIGREKTQIWIQIQKLCKQIQLLTLTVVIMFFYLLFSKYISILFGARRDEFSTAKKV